MKDIKEIVKEKYGEIAEKSNSNNSSSCCDSFCSGGEDTSLFADDYSKLKGYQKDADLNLGCGFPTEFAKIKKGDTVVDLGSGAGNDSFVSRAEAGETGKVIGIDFTEAMVEKARRNADILGFTNIEFFYGDIEEIPLPDNTADVVVSNCVLNLVPDKQKAFAETHRILKPGGHFSISDIVTEETLPEGLQKAGEMYAVCVAGAIRIEEYLDIIRSAGFQNITIQKQKPVVLPTEILTQYLSEEELKTYNQKQTIYSITVYGEKG